MVNWAENYQRDGFAYPIRVMSEDDAFRLRQNVETLESEHSAGSDGYDLAQLFRVNGQLVLPLLHQIAVNPSILDTIEGILGPNLLVWSVELFIKEPGTQKSVSWHQDLTYWGMGETDEEVTAWLALSDVSVEAGCMRFQPGSHKGSIVAHTDTFGADNLLSRGQEIQGVDESRSVHGPLKPGELSLHHGRTFHASGPNNSNDRRIGVAIRYVTPEVHQSESGRDYAMLVRGRDAAGGWIHVAPPQRNFEPSAMALYEEVLHAQSTTLAAGAKGDVRMYAAKGTTL